MSEPTPRRRGPYARSKATKAALLDAAVAAFAEVGYNGASLREIAAHANVTQTGLLHHFPTKVALLEAVLDERDHADREAISEFLDAGASVIDALVLLVERNQQQRPIIELFTALAAEATDINHPAHSYFQLRYSRVAAQFTTELEHVASQGDLRPGLSPGSTARLVIAVLDGLQLQWLYSLSIPDVEPVDMVSEIQQFLTMLRP